MPLRVATWNVDRYSDAVHRDVLRLVADGCDVICLQEIRRKAPPPAVDGYVWRWNPAARSQHWGTAVLARAALDPEWLPCPVAAAEDEGRAMAVRLGGVTVMCVYVPNAGVDKKAPLARLEYRLAEWDPALVAAVDAVEGGLVLCGDLNVAVREIDVHNPKALRKKAGFTDAERESAKAGLFARLGDAWACTRGADAPGFTFWGRYPTLKANDKGWRLDYQLFADVVPTAATIHRDFDTSDHVPLVVNYLV